MLTRIVKNLRFPVNRNAYRFFSTKIISHPVLVPKTEREKLLLEQGRKEGNEIGIQIGRELEKFQNPKFQAGYQLGWREGIKDKRELKEIEQIMEMHKYNFA